MEACACFGMDGSTSACACCAARPSSLRYSFAGRQAGMHTWPPRPAAPADSRDACHAWICIVVVWPGGPPTPSHPYAWLASCHCCCVARRIHQGSGTTDARLAVPCMFPPRMQPHHQQQTLPNAIELRCLLHTYVCMDRTRLQYLAATCLCMSELRHDTRFTASS